MNKVFCLSLFLLFMSPGCCFLEKQPPTASLKDEITIQSIPSIYNLNIYQRGEFIYVSGKIKKSIGMDLNRIKVNTAFMDEQGNVLIETQESLIIRRARLPTGTIGYFVTRIPYDPNIKICNLNINWKS